jgi:very-short-patch-repair endonuclease
MPEERRKKIAASHIGIRHSLETRERISKSLKKRIEEVGPLRTKESLIAGAATGRETKLRNGYYEIFSQKMRGRRRKMPEITKERMRASKIRFFKNGGTCWMKGKSHSQETREKLSNATAKMWKQGAFDRGNGMWRSRLEERVCEYLSAHFECFHSRRIENFVFDIFIPSLNLLIEVNGDYWHFNPEIYPHDYYDKHRSVVASEIWHRDQEKAEIAKKRGYNFCTVWQRDINKNFQGAIENAISSFKGEDRQWETNTPA